MEYIPTIGLEVHAELATTTKMFCRSLNDSDERRANVNICPVCMGHPGTLPVINKKAVHHVLRVGAAIGGTIADFTEFDRKNYFYPDIPKGYQISQYKYPLVSGGSLAGVAITRVHLEEDTARSTHDKKHKGSLVDFNRAGVALMELVTEPVITTSKQAGNFARELQLLLRYLGASDADMEKGHMRVEANVSISTDPGRFGTKVEVKNINSFNAVERAIDYEIARHIDALERKEPIVQETRGWDDAKQQTFSQRTKERAFDYRYFPDPDLPKLKISEITEFARIAQSLPELPWEKRDRFSRDYGVRAEAVEIFVQDLALAAFFEEVAKSLGGDRDLIALASNYVTSDIVGMMKNNPHMLASLRPAHLAIVMRMLKAGEISSRGAKELIVLLASHDVDPRMLAKDRGLIQESNADALTEIAKKIIEDNPKVVADFKAGKEQALMFLVGQGMKHSRGSANPAVLKALFIRIIG